MSVRTYHMVPGRTALEDAVAVREGFSWGAFAFGPLWAAARGMPVEAAALAVVPLAIGLAAAAFGGAWEAGGALAALWALFAGCMGNDLRRASLERRGYVLAGIAAARSAVEADRRFLAAAAARAGGAAPGRP